MRGLHFRRLGPGIGSIALAVAIGLAGCGDGGTGGGSSPVEPPPIDPPVEPPPAEPPLDVPPSYAFESRFDAGESSVSYSGQTHRQILIKDMVSFISSLTEDIDSGAFTPAAGDVAASLNYYFEFDSDTSSADPIELSTTPPLLQTTYGDISTDKDLASKLAGNDEKGQHEDWSSGFRGWNGPGRESPESLVRALFDALDERAVARVNGEPGLDPDGVPIPEVYVTPEGLDLKQLIEKFLLMAVNYSQGTDDYLDNDLEDHGINSQNAARASDTAPYTSLEHGWDEGFGYFGAARDYADYTDDEVAGADGRPEYASSYHDTNGDGAIDLTSEINFHASVNAAKRDRGSSPDAPTDFSKDATDGFLRGRAIIAAADGPLSDEEMAELVAARDQAVRAWENAIAATVVHYINDTLGVMETIGTAAYSFSEHAKVWSEMKGFGLGLQFNPHSPLSDQDFVTLHELLRDAPVLPGDSGVEAYREDLLAARDLIGRAYGFAEANLTAW